MPVIQADQLTTAVVEIYAAAGTPAANAQTVARHQVGANLAGHDSHGIQLLPSYVERIDRGHIDPTAEPKLISESPASLFIDGRWGFGPVVTEWTTRRAMEKAAQAGICVASIREQSHVGRLAGYVSLAAEAGFIAMMMCDSGQAPKQVAPFGGKMARLGTNPLAIAFPSNLPSPVCIDIATSAAAAAKLKVARARNEPIPPGWLIDKDGNESTDPNDFFAGGALLPLGGREGYKGYGLSFAVETLAAVLPGLGFGIDPLGRHNDGTFLLVIDPGLFRPVADLRRDIDDFVAYLKQTPTVPGVAEVFYPGELEFRQENERRAHGIPVDDATWSEFTAVADRFGVRVAGA